MADNSQKVTGRVDWDIAQLLDVVHYPRGPERTLAVLMSFISNNNYVEIVRRLKKEDVVKLVDVIDQVSGVAFIDARLTTTSMTRPSDQLIQENLNIWRCYGHWVLFVVPLPNSHTQQLFPTGWKNAVKWQ